MEDGELVNKGNEGFSLTEVAKMFGKTEEELQREIEEAHAAGQWIDITEELLAWDRKKRQEATNFPYAVLRLLAAVDCFSEPIYWACHGEYAPITFFVNCNDLFHWATADTEKLTPEDLPALKQALREVMAITGKTDIYVGFELWVARKRKMRPQQPAYPKDERLRALFDACGPIRTSTEEG